MLTDLISETLLGHYRPVSKRLLEITLKGHIPIEAKSICAIVIALGRGQGSWTEEWSRKIIRVQGLGSISEASPREAVLHVQLSDVPVSHLARTIPSYI